MDMLEMTNAAQQGIARYLEWKETFLSEWQESMMRGQIKLAFSMMPPQMKEMMKQQDPEGFAQIMSMMEGDTNGIR